MVGVGITGIIRKLKKIIFPPRCLGCLKRLDADSEDIFCPKCREKWEKHKRENCRRCGQSPENCWCGVRGDIHSDITREHHLVQYDKWSDSIIKRLIYTAKKRKNSRLTDTIAEEMYNNLYPRIDFNDLVLCYVPRSPVNIKRFGHDQARNIAQSFSLLTGLEIADVLTHNGNSVQRNLSAEQRIKNAAVSYGIVNGAGKYVKGKNVILIDDVITTGATASRCAHLLKKKGAARVFVFTLAKTI